MAAKKRRRAKTLPDPLPAVPDWLPALRYSIAEAARILRMSRGQLYKRIDEGAIRPQKDGARTYFTQAELERYVNACAGDTARAMIPADNGFRDTRRHRPSL
jgi:excisionase family DNA binding protein